MKRYLVCTILMFGVISPLVFAVPHIKISSPDKHISVDQNATLTLQLEWPASEDPYEINSLEPKVENLTLVDQHQSQETGSVISQTITYSFRPLHQGTAFIYPFEISYRKSDADPWSPLLVPEQNIRVTSGVPVKSLILWLSLLCGAAAAVFTALKIVKFFNKQRSLKETPPPDPKQRIYANAEEAIATFASPDSKAKITHWSQQFRTVVATYYDAPTGTGSNTALLALLKTKELPSGEWNEVSRLLDQLTEMQFSRQDLPSSDLEKLQKTLLQYIKGKIIIKNPDSY